jgi:hypothetical protein
LVQSDRPAPRQPRGRGEKAFLIVLTLDLLLGMIFVALEGNESHFAVICNPIVADRSPPPERIELICRDFVR